ncbi:MAG: ThiF family adenylyltransferase [Hydrogenophaga sp.]|nr:ThiF family adenylyltransferase [Hydrogenophaga sp.]
MFRKLVSRNADLARLVEKGYAIAFDSNCLIIRDVPYLDQHGALRRGAIATKMVPVDATLMTQEDHTILFAGEHPCGLDGLPIPAIDAGTHTLSLSDACKDIVVERRFSNKPHTAGAWSTFKDFFDKIESYVAIICGPAAHKHDASPLTFKSVEDEPPPSVFKFRDALTSKAEIADLSNKFEDEVIAIVGLGGSGAYALDYLVKTPAREIRGFDGDAFHVHNAFRSPGRLTESELGQLKAVVYQARYESFRSGLKLESRYIDGESGDAFEGVTFAFVCVDKGSARSAIFDLLIAKEIPFIDIGMGLKRSGGPLNGMLRVTYYSPEEARKVRDMGLAEMGDGPENLYRTNVQIAELNALNAALAVLLFKQLRGFYVRTDPLYHLLFDLGDLKIVGKGSDEED